MLILFLSFSSLSFSYGLPILGLKGDFPTATTIECIGTHSEYGPAVTVQAPINDDYCDCEDGRDEPGTAACSASLTSSTFYCANKGANSQEIFRSRVGDGVCDCCDGTDESAVPNSPCTNTCKEDGKAWREERTRQAAQMREGMLMRDTYIELGRAKISEIDGKRTVLEQDLKALHGITKNLETNKMIMEAREVEAAKAHHELHNNGQDVVLHRSRILEVLHRFVNKDGEGSGGSGGGGSEGGGSGSGGSGESGGGEGGGSAESGEQQQQQSEQDDYTTEEFGLDLLAFVQENQLMSQFRTFLLSRLPTNAVDRTVLPLPPAVVEPVPAMVDAESNELDSLNQQVTGLEADIQSQLNDLLKEAGDAGMEDIKQEAMVSV